MPTISIVIPNHNYSRFFSRCFNSLATQHLGLEDVEIIFVDDASTDDSLARIEEWAERIECENFIIEALDRQGHPGPVRNHGLSLARGEYLFCLDPDDALRPEFTAVCLEVLKEDPRAAGVYPDYFRCTPEGRFLVELPDFDQALLRMQNILPTTALYRRELWDAGVRYADNTDYEDWDFWIQCVSLGAHFEHICDPLYDYHFHDDNFSRKAESNDGPSKAAIVRNNPDFFHPLVRQWAEDFRRGRLHAQAFPRGHIPSPDDVRALLKTVESTVLGAGDK
ncbi:glycosyltransferase family 2 protein [Pseudodesulfovibrio indicus]|uniref:Family 2 glycosyl transferase n=1 Tax=Pseudodesulfovibrio indicus TaxID=1716143 RepID=A0A126QKJ0_9BACT|nr:glycosyltransferase family A protein [Pseudodesulfovibrio indicus]AMK10504.1 family 2 glycosyl transferase [Pseudodesulfovibrio indicus]TDT89096.1 glycosyl transferase family 2 [Pseudodesulfovibrio indicus]